MKILISIDYNEVYHKMLECYSMQPLPNRTLDENSPNREQTKLESLITQLSTKIYYYEKNAPHTNSHASTLYDYDTTTTIKDNIHVKYKTTKGFSNHKMTNMLTTK